MKWYNFSNIELRYLASCLIYPEFPFYKEKLRMRNYIRHEVLKGNFLEFSSVEIKDVFPRISRLIEEGFFEQRTPQSYFEGTDLAAHNMRLYKYAKKFRKQTEMLKSIEFCCVRPVDISNGIVASFSGDLEARLDTDYFEVNPSKFGFTHGFTDKGLILIRDVSEEEYCFMLEFFRERQKSKRNPFRKF